MAIKIKSLEKIASTYTEQQFIYKDLSLDIFQTKIQAPGFKIPVPGSDIRASFDLAAIMNSLQNLFNTIPGQRFLFPEYGLSLLRYLFSTVNQTNGDIISKKIVSTINTWESRVQVRDTIVEPDPDNNQYTINILVDIPSLKLTTTFNTILDIKKQTFQVLPTSRLS